MNKNRKNKIIFIIIILVLVAVAICCFFIINKKNEKSVSNVIPRVKYSVSGEKNQFIEDKNLKITVNNIAHVSEYLIIEYDVDIKDPAKEYFSCFETVDNDFEYKIGRNLIINGEVVLEYYDVINQISYKVSDTEALVYDIIDVNDLNLKDEFELDIEFVDDIGDEENSKIDDEDSDLENIEDEINPDTFELTEEYEEFDVNEETLNEFSGEEENDLQEDNEEVVNEDDADELIDENEEVEETEEIEEVDDEFVEDDSVSVIIGILKFTVSKDEIIDGNSVENLENTNYGDGDFSVNAKKILKTSFGNFVVIESEINNVSYDGENLHNNPDLFGIDGENISVMQTYKMYVNGKEMDISMYNDEYVNVTAKVMTVVLINNVSENKEIELQPYMFNLVQKEEDGELIEDFEKKKIGNPIKIDI